MPNVFVVNELFEAVAEPTIDPARPTFVLEYPAAISPLTRPLPDNPALGARWDLFIEGMEIGTAYTELNDPDVQIEKFRQQLAGPGAIATVITLTAHHSGSSNLIAVLIAIAAASLALILTLSVADRLTKRLPTQSMRVIIRFMGLIILTVGARFVLAGFHAYRPV